MQYLSAVKLTEKLRWIQEGDSVTSFITGGALTPCDTALLEGIYSVKIPLSTP